MDAAINALKENKLDQAIDILNSLELSDADNPQFWNIRAATASRLQQFDKAASYLEKALSLKKDDVTFLQNLAVCYKSLKNYTEAEHLLKKAIKIEPNNLASWRNLGNLYYAQRKKKAAIAAFKQAVELGETSIHFLYEIALDYVNQDNFEKSIGYYQKILKQEPDNERILFELTSVYLRIRKIKAGIDFLTNLKQTANKQALYEVFIANLRLGQKNWQHYQDDLQTILQDLKAQLAIPNAIPRISAFMSLLYINDNKLNLEIAKRFSAYKPDKIYQHKFNKRDKNKKLRVGFVSDDFRNHPVAHLCKRLFECLNAENIETYIYGHSADENNLYHAYVKKTATQYRHVLNLTYEQVADIIYQDKIDILIDMKGQTTNTIMPMFAHRPAPVQIAYLGYPSTTGADYLDYIIVDKTVAPIAHQQYFTEKFIYLPNCYQVNDDQQKISNKIVKRADYGLDDNQFVYCCFNNPYKIEPKVFKIWMNILKSVPNSVLWLIETDKEEQNSLRQNALKFGIDDKRIIFTHLEEKDKHLRRLQLADLFLDTYIVGAHTTTSDSLWAGVPILTCTGDRFVSRVCTSLLLTQGLSELVTTDLDAYQQKAIDYGQNPKKVKTIKNKIKQNNKLMPLYNTTLYAKDFSRALHMAWERYCDGLAPDILYVERSNK